MHKSEAVQIACYLTRVHFTGWLTDPVAMYMIHTVSMGAGVTGTLILIILTADTSVAMAAFTVEAIHKVVAEAIIGTGVRTALINLEME